MDKASTLLFLVFASIAVLSALNILIQRNPLYGALSLIGTLVSLSALYVMLRAQFIAAIQVVVYAGAIMVLFIFVIMLLNVPKDQPQIEKQKGLRYLAVPFAGVMIAEMFYVFFDNKRPIRLTTMALPSSNVDQAVGTTWNIG